MMSTAAPCHIVFVHGTFARGAAWAAQGSPIEKRIEEGLSKQVAFSRHEWSGGNSFADRLESAGRLKELMNRILDREPSAHIFLIAHSHGGNIALQASCDARLVHAIKGIVCLSTPVIHCRRVESKVSIEIAHFLFWMYGLLMLAAVAAPLGVFLFFWRHDSLGLNKTYIPEVLAVLTGLAAAAAAAYGATSAAVWVKGFAQWQERRGDAIVEGTRTPTIARERVLFLRHAGDEAGSIAGAVNIVSWILGRATESLNRFIGKISSYIWKEFEESPIISGIVITGFLIMTIQRVASSSDVALLFIPVALGILSLWAFLAIFIHLVRFLISAILMIFFGGEMLFLGSTVRLTAEATPPGQWEVVTLPNFSQEDRRICGESTQTYAYAHGRVYEDDLFLRYISTWLAERLV